MRFDPGAFFRRFRWAAGLVPLVMAGCVRAPNPNFAGTEPRAVDCAPYARELTGLALSGAAYQWWDQAERRYPRSQTPAVGAVLVFRRSGRLPDGHVAVVDRLVSARDILVNQANWIHGLVSRDDEVHDVSAGNDWTLVRVWWRPAGALGITPYPTYGFVGPADAAVTLGTNRSLQEVGSGAICAPAWIDTAAPIAG